MDTATVTPIRGRCMASPAVPVRIGMVRRASMVHRLMTMRCRMTMARPAGTVGPVNTG
jgi:hypothetical protein